MYPRHFAVSAVNMRGFYRLFVCEWVEHTKFVAANHDISHARFLSCIYITYLLNTRNVGMTSERIVYDVNRRQNSVRVKPYGRIIDRPERHPHCLESVNLIRTFSFQERLDHGNSPRKKYAPRTQRACTSVLHLGQRKLLMSEIATLLRLDVKIEYVAVYAGAAPGGHIPLLSEMFPNVIFHLYDPAPFQIESTERIQIFNMCFTDEIALSYAADQCMPVVFISDIRRTCDELMVWEDMLAQKRWHETMNPILTSLKFRLPWPGNGVVDSSNLVEYLNGDIYLPIWGPVSTT